ncbi:LysR family transcriptional regulator [uncultured Caballeronia sp.]|uniref:helix-turn-helix domain-containing protein n=1 Tax=uncultured Caballeronia sp. TaxID=1827198 RepID=UPI0035CCA3FA
MRANGITKDRLAAIGIFIRVVGTGSFSPTARHYDVGQPAVLKAIAQLEDWLGVNACSAFRLASSTGQCVVAARLCVARPLTYHAVPKRNLHL